jgi:hypothetical protein
MTKKHFIQLADTIKAQRPCSLQLSEICNDEARAALKQWEQMRDAIADFCQAQNPYFNRQRWFGYIEGKCGPSGGKVKA